MVDDYQVVVKWITKHLLSINGRKDWKKKNNCWQDREENSILNSHLESSQIWVARPACVCMESVALGIMAKSQPQTVPSRRGSAGHCCVSWVLHNPPSRVGEGREGGYLVKRAVVEALVTL